MKKLVSVISPFYNRAEYVRDSVQSLIDQTYENLEIILIDDCSTDNTYEELCKFNDPRIRIIRHEINVGVTKGLINAINKSKGEYIAIHGSGDISYPERIAKQAELLDGKDDVGVVDCWFVERLIWSKGIVETKEAKPNADNKSLEDLIKNNIFNHGNCMMRRRLFEKAAGYRPAFYMCADYDLWLRMRKHCEFSTVKEVCYERKFIPNSISAMPIKKIIQIKYKNLAKQSARLRHTGKPDIVDVYGENALGFVENNTELALSFYKLFVYLSTFNTESSLSALTLSLKAKLLIRNCAAFLLVKVVGFRFFSLYLKLIRLNLQLGIKRRLRNLYMCAKSKN